MPRMRKPVRKGRTRASQKPRSRGADAPEGTAHGTSGAATPDHGIEEEVRTITSGQLHAEPLEQLEPEADGGGGVGSPVGETPAGEDPPHEDASAAHEAAGTGEPAGAEAPPAFGAEELLGLVKLGREVLVTVLAATRGVKGPEVEELKSYSSDSWDLMRSFAPAAARYMPFLNAHANLIGAVCFFGLAGLDTSAAVKRIGTMAKAERKKRAAESPASAVPPAVEVLGMNEAPPGG